MFDILLRINFLEPVNIIAIIEFLQYPSPTVNVLLTQSKFILSRMLLLAGHYPHCTDGEAEAGGQRADLEWQPYCVLFCKTLPAVAFVASLCCLEVLVRDEVM